MSSRLPEATGLLHRKQPLALCRAYSTKPRCPARQGHLQCRAGTPACVSWLNASAAKLRASCLKPFLTACTLAAGILDKYREEKGIASPGASSTGVLQRPQLPSQQQEDDDEEGEDEGVCTTECVREFTTEAQFERILHDAGPDSLVVVDFFRSARATLAQQSVSGKVPALCVLAGRHVAAANTLAQVRHVGFEATSSNLQPGLSCSWVCPGFLKLCNISHEEHAPVHFAKSNVFDE